MSNKKSGDINLIFSSVLILSVVVIIVSLFYTLIFQPSKNEIFFGDSETFVLREEIVPAGRYLHDLEEINKSVIITLGNSKDEFAFFYTFLFLNLSNKQLKYYVSYLPENIEKLENNPSLIENARRNLCIPHEITYPGYGSKYYVANWLGTCNYFYEIDLEKKTMKVISKNDLGIVPLVDTGDNIFYSDESELFFFSAIEAGSKYFDNDNLCSRGLYSLSPDMNETKLIYKTDYEYQCEPYHFTYYLNGTIYNFPFFVSSTNKYIIDGKWVVEYDKIKEFIENRHPNLNFSSNQECVEFLLKMHDVKPLPSQIEYFNIDDNVTGTVKTSAVNPAHAEVIDDEIYVSNHNFAKIGQDYIVLTPAVIDKYAFNGSELILEDNFSINYGYRFASHGVGKCCNKTYITTFAHPNRLLVINADNMSLWYYEDIGKEYLKGKENISSDNVNAFVNSMFDAPDSVRKVAVIDEKDYLITLMNNEIIIFSIPERKIIADVGFKPNIQVSEVANLKDTWLSSSHLAVF